MPTISDQVAALEHDHADALAKIESQSRSLETLTLSLAAMTKEKLALEARIVEYQKHEEATIAAVEVLANASLDMLRIAQRPAGTAVVPYAPKLKTVTAAEREPARQADAKPAGNATAQWAVPFRPPSPIIEPASAVDIVKRHLLPALTLMRRPTPVNLTMGVRHDTTELPMFLRRDTVFARAAAHG